MVARKYENSEGLKSNMKMLAEVLRMDSDAVFLLSGPEGVGKSTLAIWLAKWIQEAYSEMPRFNVSQIAFTPDQFFKLVQNLPKFYSIIADEGVELAYSRDAMKYENKRIMKALYQIRQKNLAIFFLVPDKSAIDKTISEHRALAWLHVPQRGKVMVHKRRKSPYQKQIYWDLVFVDSFDKLDGKLWTDYLKVKAKAFEHIDDSQSLDVLSPFEKKKMNHVLKKAGLTQRKRGEILGVSDRMIRYYDKG